MSLVIDLPPDVETQVRQAAEAKGVDISTFLRNAAAPFLLPSGPPEWMSESDLLKCINQGFSEKFWNRFRVLSAKCSDGSMSPRQQKEFLAMTDETEKRAVERLTYLVELAKRRGTTYLALMDKMGLHPVSFED